MSDSLDRYRISTPSLREPEAEDGADIWELVRACKPLDENSMYCNLIQCDHFSKTCVVAELDGVVVGWVSAYVLPHDPETLFVWQVAVSEKARGTGLGSLMLSTLLQREACAEIKRLQTTITIDNEPSWALFRKFAKTRQAQFNVQDYFEQALHFRERHRTEHLVTIDLEEQMRKVA